MKGGSVIVNNGKAEDIVRDETILAPGTIVRLLPGRLITGEYQRNLRPVRVKKLARNFDPRLCGVLLVTERNGNIYLIDGQHRAAAAIAAGRNDVPIPCLVVDASTYEEEAELFIAANNRSTTVPVTTGEIFHARVEAGDPTAIEVLRIAEEVGLYLDLHMRRDSTLDGAVRAIATLVRIYRVGGPEHLRDVLETITRAFGNRRSAWTHYVLMGYHQLLYRYHGIIDRERLAAVARGLGIEGLNARAAMRRMSNSFGRNDSGIILGRVLVDACNEGLRSHQQLPDWDVMLTPPPSKLPEGQSYFTRPMSKPTVQR
jgi:hypothetical protein